MERQLIIPRRKFLLGAATTLGTATFGSAWNFLYPSSVLADGATAPPEVPIDPGILATYEWNYLYYGFAKANFDIKYPSYWPQSEGGQDDSSSLGCRYYYDATATFLNGYDYFTANYPKGYPNNPTGTSSYQWMLDGANAAMDIYTGYCQAQNTQSDIWPYGFPTGSATYPIQPWGLVNGYNTFVEGPCRAAARFDNQNYYQLVLNLLGNATQCDVRDNGGVALGYYAYPGADQREYAYAATAYLCANVLDRIDLNTQPALNLGVTYSWNDRLNLLVNCWLNVWPACFTAIYAGTAQSDPQGDYMASYETMLACYALILYDQILGGNAAVQSAIKFYADISWVYDYMGAAGGYSFRYTTQYSAAASAASGSNAALNNIYAPIYAYVALVTGDSAYQQFADVIFSAGVASEEIDFGVALGPTGAAVDPVQTTPGQQWNGTAPPKMFDQNFHYSFDYIRYRRCFRPGVPGGIAAWYKAHGGTNPYSGIASTTALTLGPANPPPPPYQTTAQPYRVYTNPPPAPSSVPPTPPIPKPPASASTPSLPGTSPTPPPKSPTPAPKSPAESKAEEKAAEERARAAAKLAAEKAKAAEKLAAEKAKAAAERAKAAEEAARKAAGH